MPIEEVWLEPYLEDVRGTVFFDVGANRGDFTEWACKRFEYVWSFEPDPRAFAKLLAKSKCNVVPFQKAVADQSYRGRLGVSTESLQSMLLTGSGDRHPFGHGEVEHEIGVDVIALRDVDMVPDWVKIDVEGGEPAVIRGMRDAHPNLLVECHGNFDEVLAELTKKGYTDERRAIVVNHPHADADPGHRWLLVEGAVGFSGRLKEIANG